MLAEFFLAQLNAAGGTSKVFSESAMARLESDPWPGNVRELYNVVQRAYILTESRTITHPCVHHDALPPPATVATGELGSIQIRVGESLAEVEQRLILHTLSSCRTKDEAARILGVSTKTLYNKLRRYESEVRAANGAAQAPARVADARAN